MTSHHHVVADFTTYTYCGELDRFCMERGLLEGTPEANKVSAKVRSLYDAGVAFYSKEVIQDVARQLNSESQEIIVQGLDGSPVSFKRETGQALDHWGDSEYDWLIRNPFLDFISVQGLCSHAHGYAPGLSICSMRVCHYLTKLSKTTNRSLSPVPTQSRDEVLKFFTAQREAWTTSKPCKELRSILLVNMPCKVTKIVAFACGGIAFGDQMPMIHAKRSAYQHALILTLRDVLAEFQGPLSQIECYAQDPVYCNIDGEVLKTCGITILDSPRGFLEVDDATVVLSFNPDIPVRQIIADISRPAMMIWNKSELLANEIDDGNGADPDSPRLIRMIQNHYKAVEYPGDLDAFHDIRVYLRKENLL